MFQGIKALEIQTSRWERRGWTFQEEMLSTRILYFGHTMLFFECRHFKRSEIDDCRYLELRLPLKGEPWRTDISVPYDLWESAVQHFSDRQFTYPLDTFPAISSLARSLGEPSKDRYIAALWRGALFRELLWTTEPRAEWQLFV